MLKRNQNLKQMLNEKVIKPELVNALNIPKPNTVNREGFSAYELDKWLKLLSILNTSKFEKQFYRDKSELVYELFDLVKVCAIENVYLTAQCIVYSRCVASGMRTINNLAAAFLAPYLSGLSWSKDFFSKWDKKKEVGGLIFRPTDMNEIAEFYQFGENSPKLTNSMKKGFANAIEKMDTYTILKYKRVLVDLINLVHPNIKNSTATIEFDGKEYNTIDAIMKGIKVSADTWEVAQVTAGQEVAQAVKDGKISEDEAEVILKEAKAENWSGLLKDGKLPTLAALRNIRNILDTVTDAETINLLCNVLSDSKNILDAKIMPFQIDLAYEVVITEFNTSFSRLVQDSLLKGYEASIPNLTEVFKGNNLVIIDMSGSMCNYITNGKGSTYKSSCLDKASLIGCTIAKATNADIIRFGSHGEYINYDINQNVFALAKSIQTEMGGTSLMRAWEIATTQNRKYDRVFILSDNECNIGNSYESYKEYVQKVGNPYVYSIDLCGYGTTQLVGERVKYLYGYGLNIFNDILNSEFNAEDHLDKVKQIKFK